VCVKNLLGVVQGEVMKKGIPALLLLTVLSTLAAQAQSRTTAGQPPKIEPTSKANSRDPLYSDQNSSNLPDEIRIKMALKRAEDEHRKVLEDVDKLSELSSEIATELRDKGKLASDDMKKLGTIEKLARRILSHAGGEPVSEAVDKMSSAIESIKKSMTTQTRHIVSAAVIASSNEVINLSQFIRKQQKN
jgi:hypothetical protein